MVPKKEDVINKNITLFKTLRTEKQSQYDIIRGITERIIQCQKGCFQNAKLNLIPDEQQWDDLEDEWFDYLCDELVNYNKPHDCHGKGYEVKGNVIHCRECDKPLFEVIIDMKP